MFWKLLFYLVLQKRDALICIFLKRFLRFDLAVFWFLFYACLQIAEIVEYGLGLYLFNNMCFSLLTCMQESGFSVTMGHKKWKNP